MFFLFFVVEDSSLCLSVSVVSVGVLVSSWFNPFVVGPSVFICGFTVIVAAATA
jgi:hypothetical protein